MLLHESTGVFDLEHNNTHVVTEIALPEGADQLTIDLWYDPLALTDADAMREVVLGYFLREHFGCPAAEENVALLDAWVKRSDNIINLITLSLDGPAGFVGALHRHGPTKHIGVRKGAAPEPGLTRVDEMAGTWRVWMDVQCIVTPCNYRLTICADMGGATV